MSEFAFERGREAGVKWGERFENERIIKLLTDYLELTKFSEDVEGAEPNAEWVAGFNAAITLAKKEKK